MTARVTFCRQQTGELSGVEWLDIDDVLIERAEEWHEPQTHADDLAMLQYTSGSTGAPKGVQLRHNNILYNSERLRIAFEHNADSVVVVWLPLFHDMGLIGNLLQPLYAGCRSVLMPPMHFLKQPIRWLHTISRHQATTSGGPNFAFDLCVDAITPEQRATLDLSTWRVAFNGAERVRFQTIERFSAYFAPAGFRRTAFYPCYGLAEGTLIVTGGRVAEPPRFAAPARKERTDTINGRRPLFVGCGSALPGHDVRIVDPETGLEQPDTTVGEIWIAGKDVASGYWRQLPTEHDFAARMHGQGDGKQFFRTGDLGFIADHELYITGRRKDLIIINGRNHYPEDLEATVARTDPNFLANGCVAVSVDEDGKELVYLLVEVQSGLIQDLAALRDAIDRELAFEHEIVPKRVYSFAQNQSRAPPAAKFSATDARR